MIQRKASVSRRRPWSWAEIEYLRWCCRLGRSAPEIAILFQAMDRTEAAIVIRASVLGLHLAARGPQGAPAGNSWGRKFWPGNPGYGFRRKAAA